jgi:sporulation protein YlmC with PRC-barrel domain
MPERVPRGGPELSSSDALGIRYVAHPQTSPTTSKIVLRSASRLQSDATADKVGRTSARKPALGVDRRDWRSRMSEATEFDIGSEVVCSDGVCGDLARVVIDPVARAVTHLVVEPRHRRGYGHLVPVERVAPAGHQIRLTCTKAEFEGLDEAEDTDFLPAAGGQLGYGHGEVVSWPYYRLYGGGGGEFGVTRTGPYLETYDHLPLGEVEVKRGDQVHATDGPIGQVHGLVIDPGNHHVTHFLLQEGHLWGKKQVAIPISAVTRIGDWVRVNLTKDEVRDLPSVDLDLSEGSAEPA